MGDPETRGPGEPGAPDRSDAAAGTTGDRLRVEVVYALPQGAIELVLRLQAGATVAHALAAAAADHQFRGLDLDAAAVGVFGVAVRRDRALEQGDRVEIYRPLAADPKAARRARVKQARARRG
jgi:uncharacterized protein